MTSLMNSDDNSPPTIRFVGRSGSGKTTLVSALIGYWTENGLRVGAIKHASKSFQMDRPGKDSHRFRTRGAAAIAVASPTEFAVIASTQAPATVAELAAHLPSDLDVIVVEGYKGDGGPAVLVHRGEQPLLSTERILPGLFAIATDRPGAYDMGVPQFNLSDIASLATFLEHELNISSRVHQLQRISLHS